MAFLQCNFCDSKFKAIQVSHRFKESGEERFIELIPGPRQYQISDWGPKNYEYTNDGYYCPNCKQPLDMELGEIKLWEDTRVPCILSSEFSAEEVGNWVGQLSLETNIEVYRHRLPAQPPNFGDLAWNIAPELESSLKNMGVNKLYSHQAEAANLSHNGDNVVLVTSTASGKTLSYNLPILDSIIKHTSTRALYLFPTKALADDQLGQLLRFSEDDYKVDLFGDEGDWYEQTVNLGEHKISVGRLDGDTPPASRVRIKNNAHIWMSNPDMLQHSILPAVFSSQKQSEQIRNFLKNLRTVVIDEMHLYKGTFGSHVALVLRRLQSICQEIGNPDIKFFMCSATIEHPELLAQSLTGKSNFKLVDNDGSQKPYRESIFVNPGKGIDGKRRAASSEAFSIAREIIVRNKKIIRSIIFQESRSKATIYAKTIKDVIRKSLKISKEKVQGMKLATFYTGLLPNDERKEIIELLKQGDIHVIVTTNALEVGIDIGDLSLSISVGYPGSKASFNQQAGRIGRKGEGVAILIWMDEPLQQYYMRNIDAFINKPPEIVRINPFNERLVLRHLPLLQQELGRSLSLDDVVFLLDGNSDKAVSCYEAFKVKEQENDEVDRFSIRDISKTTYQVVDRRKKRVVIESVDEWSAKRDLFPKAIYWTPDEKAYQVVAFRNKGKQEISVESLGNDCDYYTQSIHTASITVTENPYPAPIIQSKLPKYFGKMQVKKTVVAFKKIYRGENPIAVPAEQLEPPLSMSFETEGTWIELTEDLINNLQDHINEIKNQLPDINPDIDFINASIRAAEHIISVVIPDVIITDPNDIGSFSGYNLPGFKHKTVIGLYGERDDSLGITEAIFDNYRKITRRALDLLNSCKCNELDGCPSCIQIHRKNNEPLLKSGAKIILEHLVKSLEELQSEARF